MHYITLQIKVAIILLITRITEVNSRKCSSEITQGPFTLQKTPLHRPDIQFSGVLFMITEVVSDVQIYIGYRSYWWSYCYNGGSLDSNTGCYRGLYKALPDKKELLEWEKKDMCKVKTDCIDCYGSDSDRCTGNNPMAGDWVWTKGKELAKSENKNHFLGHTCNLSWRCEGHRSNMSTYLTTDKEDRIVPYFILNNDKPVYLQTQYFNQYEDYSLVVSKPHKTLFSPRSLNCTGFEGDWTCFDANRTNLIHSKDRKIQCFKRVCYEILEEIGIDTKLKKYISAGASSGADLKSIQDSQFFEHEETKRNVMILQYEIDELKSMVESIINSVAKVDDRLIGEVLKRPSKTRFLSNDVFVISSCSGEGVTSSNCKDGQIFRDGRWVPLTDPTKCVSFNSTRKVCLWNDDTTWLPDMIPKSFDGAFDTQDAWTYLATERDALRTATEVTQNNGKTTALFDVLSMGPGSLERTLSYLHMFSGTSLILTVIMAIVVLKIALK